MIAFIALCVASGLALVVAIAAGVALLIGMRVPPLAVAAALGLPLAITHTVLTRAIAQISAHRGTVASSMADGLGIATEAADLGMWVGVLTVMPAVVFLGFAAITGVRRSPRQFAAPLLAIPLTLAPALTSLFTAYMLDSSHVQAIAMAGVVGLVGLLSGLAMLRGGDGNSRHAGAAAGVVAALCLSSLFVGMAQHEMHQIGSALMNAPPESSHQLFQGAARFQLSWQFALMFCSVFAVGFALLGASCMAGGGRFERWQALLVATVSLLLLAIAPTTSFMPALQTSAGQARMRATPRWADDMRPPRLQEENYNREAAELVTLTDRALLFQRVDLVQLTGAPPTLPESAIVDALVQPLANALADIDEPVSLAVHAHTEGRALAAVALTMTRDNPIRVYTSPGGQISLHPKAPTPLYAELTPTDIANIPCTPVPCSGASFPYDAWRTVLERGTNAHPNERHVTIFVHPVVTAEAALAAAFVADEMQLKVTLMPKSP